MHPVSKFALRAVTALIIAWIMARVFGRMTGPFLILLMAAFFVVMSYLAERLRR